MIVTSFFIHIIILCTAQPINITHSSVVEMTLLRTEWYVSVKKRRTSVVSCNAAGLASCNTIICSRGEPTLESPESMPV